MKIGFYQLPKSIQEAYPARLIPPQKVEVFESKDGGEWYKVTTHGGAVHHWKWKSANRVTPGRWVKIFPL